MVARTSRALCAWSIALLIGVALASDPRSASAQQTQPGPPIFEAVGYAALRPYLQMRSASSTAKREADAGGEAEFTIVSGRIERWRVSSDGVPWFAGYAPTVLGNAATWADMDGDGVADLVCAGFDRNGRAVEILHMGPAGLVAPGTRIPVSVRGRYLTVADVTGDGRPDIGVVEWLLSPGDMTWLLNQGANAFVEAPTSVSFGQPVAARLGPDARMDLVDWDPPYLSAGIASRAEDGVFLAPDVRFKASGRPIISDLDGDGVPDIIAGRYLYRGVAGGLPVEVDSISASASHMADVDHDGIADLVAVESGTVRVARGLGGFGFSPFTSYRAGAIDDRWGLWSIYGTPASGPFGMSALLDANGDGQADVLGTPAVRAYTETFSTARGGEGRVVYALPGLPGGAFRQVPRLQTGSAPVQVALADLVGTDGRPDLLVLARGARRLELRAGAGDGTFGAAQLYALPAGAKKFVLADLNADSKLDVAVACDTSSSIRVFAGTGTGLGASIDLASTGALNELAAADVDEDGHLDLLSMALCELRAWRGDGAMGFVSTSWSSDPAYCNNRFRVVDVDDDGHLDLVTQRYGFEAPLPFVIKRGNGQGQFTNDLSFSRQFIHGEAEVVTGDLLGDGRTYVAYAAVDSVKTTYCFVSAFTGQGGVVEPIPEHCEFVSPCGISPYGMYNGYPVAPLPRQVAIADVTGDGLPDILVLSASGGVLTVLPGLGGGRFDTGIVHIAGSDPSSFALGDVDGDGDLDAMVADLAADEVTIMRHFGGTPPGGPPMTSGSLRLQVESAPNAAQVRLRLTLPESGAARVELFDLFGRRLMGVSVEAITPGERSLTIDGSRFPRSGVLFARLTQGSAHATTRLARFD